MPHPGQQAVASQEATSPPRLLAWNGGADTNYPAEVLARKRNYSSRPG